MAGSPSPPLEPGTLLPRDAHVLENPWLAPEPKPPSVELLLPLQNPWTSEADDTITSAPDHDNDHNNWPTESLPLPGSEWDKSETVGPLDGTNVIDDHRPNDDDDDDDDEWDEPQWLVKPSVSPTISEKVQDKVKLLSPEPVVVASSVLLRKPPQFNHPIIKQLFDDNDMKTTENNKPMVAKTYPESLLQDEPNATRYYNDLQRYTPQLLKKDGTNSIVRWVDSHIQVSQRVVVDSWAGVSLSQGALKKKQPLKANKLFKWASSDAYAEQIKRDYMIKTGAIDPTILNDVDGHQQDKAPPGILNLVVNPKLSQQVFEKLTHLIELEANRFVRIRIEKKRLQLTEAMAHQISERKRKDHENHLMRLKLREEEYEREGLTTTDRGNSSGGGAAAFFNQLNFWGSSKKKLDNVGNNNESPAMDTIPLFLEPESPEEADDDEPQPELNPGDKALQAFTKLFSTKKKAGVDTIANDDDDFDDFQKALTPTPEPQPQHSQQQHQPQPTNGTPKTKGSSPSIGSQQSPASIASANKPVPNLPRPSDDFADFAAAPALPSKPKKQVLVAHNLPMAPLIPSPKTATTNMAASTILSPSSNTKLATHSPDPFKLDSILSPELKVSLPLSSSFRPLSQTAAPLQPSSRPQLRPVSMMVSNDNHHHDVLNDLEIARSVSPAKTSHPFIPLPVSQKEQNLVDLMDVFGQLPSPPLQETRKSGSSLAKNKPTETNLLDI